MISRFRTFARISGVVFLAVGLICLPLGAGGNSKQHTSLFFHFADVDGYIQIAMVLIPIGIAVILLSYLLQGN